MGWAARSRGTYAERVHAAKEAGRLKKTVGKDIPGGVNYIRNAPSDLLLTMMACAASGGWKPPKI